MSQALAGLLGAFIGALAVMGGGVIAEAYRRYRDRQGIASALAGEIAGLLHMTEKRQYVQFFEGVLPRLESGTDVPIPQFVKSRDNPLDPVIDRYLDRLGHLSGSLPERVVRFYQFVAGIRVDLERITEDGLNVSFKASLVREDLALWKEAVQLGEQLVRELQEIARTTLSARSSAFMRAQRQRLFARIGCT